MRCAGMLLAGLAMLGSAVPAGAAAQATVGRRIAERNCARCHAVGRSGQSPLAAAPRFRELEQRYPVEMLEEALAEGILTGHKGMSEFKLEPAEIEGLITYLKSIQDLKRTAGSGRVAPAAAGWARMLSHPGPVSPTN